MRLIFENKSVVHIEFVNSPITSILQNNFKHLQHVNIPHKPWDNPFFDRKFVPANLQMAGKKLGIVIDKSVDDQQYLNSLHQIYENNYDGSDAWIEFHEYIHVQEARLKNISRENWYRIAYNTLGGPLKRSFDLSWCVEQRTNFKRGDVFAYFNELGKSPYHYWQDNEPDDLNRMATLAKPWLQLDSDMLIAHCDFDFLDRPDMLEFQEWWPKWEQLWCKKWELDYWDIHRIWGGIKYAECKDTDLLMELGSKHIKPVRVEI